MTEGQPSTYTDAPSVRTSSAMDKLNLVVQVRTSVLGDLTWY